MNRKIRSGARAVVTAFALSTLAACGSSSGGGEQAATGKIGGTISVTSVDGHAKDVAAAFEKKYPGTTVKVQVVGDVSAIQQQVRTQLTSKTAPDLFSVWPGNGNPTAVAVLGAAGDFLYDLSARPWVKQMSKSLVASASYQGKVYDALYGVNGIGAIYNMDALKTAGLTPPTTWSEVLTFCAAAKSKGAVAYALGAQDSWITQLIPYALTSTLVYGPDPQFSAEQAAGKATFAGSAWTKAYELYLQMQTSGCFNQDVLGTSFIDTQKLLATGKALGAVNGNWMIAEVRKANADATYTLYPFPATDDASKTYLPVAAGAGLAVNKYTKNVSTALAFVDFYLSPEGLGIAVPIQGGLPPFPVDTVKTDASLENIVSYMGKGLVSSFPDQGWPNAKVQAAHLSGAQEILGGKASVADVLTKMQTEFTAGS
jgi:raffinose/stachyose/melibiose transport system substrate-binding protein